MPPVDDLAARIERLATALEGGAALSELALRLSAVLQPRLDIAAHQATLAELAARCPDATREGVFDHLFGSGRFQGNRHDYHGWRNSCLDHVLTSGKGMPITLTVVAVDVATRLGVGLVGIGMPGHFLAGDAADPTWFADPFTGRTGLTAGDCERTYTDLGGRHWSPRLLAPTPDRQVIMRILNNLRASCERSNDPVRLAIVMQTRQAFGEFAPERQAARRAAAVFN
jgi:regulator of sirC expression with transglutaminase-like and TPR domain